MRIEPKTGGRAALSFVSGLHFALLQASWYLLLEAHLSSQSLSYFICLFFWLCGLLLGLNLRGDRWFVGLLGAGVASYYVAWSLARWAPFHSSLYPVAAIGSVVSGLLPGFFFRFIARRYRPIRRPLLHENNGFILGLLVALRGATHFGGSLLAFAPALGAALAGAALLAWGGDAEE